MNVGTPASWSQLTENTFRQGFFQPNSRESYWLAKGLDGSHWASSLLAESVQLRFISNVKPAVSQESSFILRFHLRFSSREGSGSLVRACMEAKVKVRDAASHIVPSRIALLCPLTVRSCVPPAAYKRERGLFKSH
jgi:hypothetical protein